MLPELHLIPARETLSPHTLHLSGVWIPGSDTPAGPWQIEAWLHRELAGDLRLLGRISGTFSPQTPLSWTLPMHWNLGKIPVPYLREVVTTLYTGGSWVSVQGWIRRHESPDLCVQLRLEVI